MVGGGRYTLIKLLGEGGKCAVWSATDERLGETVALKFLLPTALDDPRIFGELRKEARRSRQLAHQNIVQLYDLYESPDELPFMIMEFVSGNSLHTVRMLDPSQFLTWDFLRPVTLQLCHALDHAHGEGLVHRDIKPANIMVDQRGRVKLADFGISGAMNDVYAHLLQVRDTRGTVTFMSPQQMDGTPPCPADDIYALGATLYELLTSRAPFYTGDIVHQVRNVIPQPVPACQSEMGIQNPIPPTVADLIMACLQKDPSARPRSAWEIAKQIDPNIGDPIVTVRYEQDVATVTAAIPQPKFSREFKIVIAALGILLFMVMAILYFTWKSGT